MIAYYHKYQLVGNLVNIPILRREGARTVLLGIRKIGEQ
jgi:hypothetical protein